MYGVPDCDGTWEGDATGTSEFDFNDLQCGDYRGKLATNRMMKCMYYYLWMIIYMAKVALR